MSFNLSRTRLGNYVVTWGTYSFGAVDKVTPDLSVKTKPIKVGSVGDVELGERIIALEGTIKIESREIDRTMVAAMMPWAATGSIPFLPQIVHKDLYDYAAVLTLHPDDVSGTAEDVTLIKAVPTMEPMDRNGNDDDKVVVTFKFYPDRSLLPVLSYGYIGPSPS